MKRLAFTLGVLVIMVIAFYAGPKPKAPRLDNTLPNFDTININNIEQYVKGIEAKKSIKPNNHAQVIWFNDSIKEKTEYSLLYLHGFSASWYEGFPANADFAKYFGCNAYFSRLAAHGLQTSEPLIDMYPDSLYESAKEALLIASEIGEKVIIMSTSTGGTLSLKLAAEFPDLVSSLILLSPNIEINSKGTFLLTNPWGLQCARLIGGGKYDILTPQNKEDDMFWYMTYRWEGVVFLQQLVEATMTDETFKKVKQPLFVGYYYKNENEQDQTVKVSAILDMFNKVSTPNNLKIEKAFPNAKDHVIGGESKSGCLPELEEALIDFGTNILGMKAANALPDSLSTENADSINIVAPAL